MKPRAGPPLYTSPWDAPSRKPERLADVRGLWVSRRTSLWGICLAEMVEATEETVGALKAVSRNRCACGVRPAVRRRGETSLGERQGESGGQSLKPEGGGISRREPFQQRSSHRSPRKVTEASLLGQGLEGHVTQRSWFGSGKVRGTQCRVAGKQAGKKQRQRVENLGRKLSVQFSSSQQPWPVWLRRLGAVPCTKRLLVRVPIRAHTQVAPGHIPRLQA